MLIIGVDPALLPTDAELAVIRERTAAAGFLAPRAHLEQKLKPSGTTLAVAPARAQGTHPPLVAPETIWTVKRSLLNT